MPPIPNTSFVLLDTGFLANAQLTNNLTAMLNAAARPGTILVMPKVVYLELNKWGVTQQQLDAYRAANPGAIEIWDASRYGGTEYVVNPDGRLPSNAADNALGELYRHLQGEGYSPGQIDIYSDNTKVSEIPNPAENTRAMSRSCGTRPETTLHR